MYLHFEKLQKATTLVFWKNLFLIKKHDKVHAFEGLYIHYGCFEHISGASVYTGCSVFKETPLYLQVHGQNAKAIIFTRQFFCVI